MRPSLGMDPDDFITDSPMHAQIGGGALVGGGVRFYDLLTIDVRAYPTSWMAREGTRAEVGADGMLTMVQIMETPGGMPITFNAGIGVAF